MRIIGTFSEEKLARRFTAFLRKEGIEAEVRSDDDSEVGVWGILEDQLETSRQLYNEFKAAPDDKRFSAPLISKPKIASEPSTPNRHRVVDVRREVFGATSSRNVVTITLIVISIALTIMVEVPQYQWLYKELMYSNYIRPMFYEISNGQIWRLVTPIFLHGGFLHILFNMLWLHTLGGQVEQYEGSRYLLIFVLVVAVTVNSAQYLMSPAPFLGMSGVVYALFGYVWMMAKYKAGAKYELSDFTVKIMLFWLVLCLFLPNIANTQHFVGAGMGAAYGYIKSGGLKSEIRRRQHRNKFK